ncbi:hypothetical protein F4804DRAFT_332629 [Jackrogersella minutella]|nr:hypothetical protein F4804DRAFT_332629 [Jackrogersella minutella]
MAPSTNRTPDRTVIVLDDDSDSPGLVPADGSSDPAKLPGTLATAKDSCRNAVISVFPDICPQYLEKLASEHDHNSNVIINTILGLQENGGSYPVKPRDNPLKRKREDDDDLDDDENKREPETEKITKVIRAKIAQPNYRRDFIDSSSYREFAKGLIATEVPLTKIRNYLDTRAWTLFEAYTAMDEDVRNWNNARPAWKEKKMSSKGMLIFEVENFDDLDIAMFTLGEQAAIAEFRAARELKSAKDAVISSEAQEKEHFAEAKSMGHTMECGCCFEEFALDRMIKCSSETTHWFCRACMKSQAETNIGLSRHELTCMSMNGCSAGFSLSQRKVFLDSKAQTALERIEQESVLRMAGIENLATCPFCPYAEEYPPVEVNKEFRCVNPSCEKVSCRLCRKETHIPKTCAESAADRGLNARHVVEEAMSAALIRTCNTCKNPFLKEAGCNKIRCTRCQTLHCYVCRETIEGYDHFNDVTRGGKEGHCPLFDETEIRHENEVQRAEEEARQKVTNENPDLAAGLKIDMSSQVQQGGKRQGRHERPFRVNFHFDAPYVPYPVFGVREARPVHGLPEPHVNIRDLPLAIFRGPVPPNVPAPARVPKPTPPHIPRAVPIRALRGPPTRPPTPAHIPRAVPIRALRGPPTRPPTHAPRPLSAPAPPLHRVPSRASAHAPPPAPVPAPGAVLGPREDPMIGYPGYWAPGGERAVAPRRGLFPLPGVAVPRPDPAWIINPILRHFDHNGHF